MVSLRLVQESNKSYKQVDVGRMDVWATQIDAAHSASPISMLMKQVVEIITITVTVKHLSAETLHPKSAY